ncbi:MAG: tyrosine-type recombinase/integrase, partial [Candidatus Acidiferrales bacterium]
DQFDAEAAEHYLQQLEKRGAAPKTICNKALCATSALKFSGVQNSSKLFNTPTVEEEPVETYSEGDLRKLFSAMDEEEIVRYSFFLYTACREQEVSHAQWSDLDWKTGEYVVRSKQYTDANGITQKFTTKNHKTRRVPLTRELVDLLKKRKASEGAHALWIFPNSEGQPEGHFLRKFKKIAFKAGLNCGHCQGGRCKKDPEGCEKHYLHRLRKTRATFWHREGIGARTIQYRLSHTSLETTQRYLGIQDSEATREIDNRPMLYIRLRRKC